MSCQDLGSLKILPDWTSSHCLSPLMVETGGLVTEWAPRPTELSAHFVPVRQGTEVRW